MFLRRIPNVFRLLAGALRSAGVQPAKPIEAAPVQTSAPPPKRRLPWWEARFPDGRECCCQGQTKSEARAYCKKMHGLGRLPPGTILRRIAPVSRVA